MSLQRKLKSLFLVTIGGIGAYSVIGFYKNDPILYKNIIMPIIHSLDAENAHKLGVLACKYRLIAKSKYSDSDLLKVKVFGQEFGNPIGIAAGFDKNGEAILGLRDIGFGFIEVGSVTPKPQSGNDRPRVFRLAEDLAVINRYGFNNDGHERVLERLTDFKNHFNQQTIIGVNLGKNKTSSDPINDYVIGVERFGPIADYLVINISSPNTPGLRNMQQKDALKKLLKNVLIARNNLSKRVPILLKLAPDLSSNEIKEIGEIVLLEQYRVDGLIISNTTVERPKYLVNEKTKNEIGGLSGQPLKKQSTHMISEMYRITKGQIPIIGAGGVFTGKDAYEKIKAGASVVQIYTSMVYEGPPIVTKIKKELKELVTKDGFKNISEAIGANHK